MDASHTIEANSLSRRSLTVDRLFDAAKKDTVIRLRWPLVILSSYLLYYIPNEWLAPAQVQVILILYLLSHSTLYFLADELFDSRYFYGPLLAFDTVVLMAVLSSSGTASPDFYVACLFTLVMSCICNDSRGLLAVTLLAPLIYGYIVFYTAETADPSIYLRLPFPFVISLFYGYFAQVERIRRGAREKDEQAKRQQRAAEEIRRQRERLEVLHRVNVSVSSTNNTERILDAFLETALIHLPYAAAIVRLKNRATGTLETVAAQGFETKGITSESESWLFTDCVVEERRPLIVHNVFADARLQSLEFLENEGLVSLLGVPLIANNETIGCLIFLTRDEHEFGEEEVDFVSTLAGQVAIVIHHSQLYLQSQQQAEELRSAHKIKDEFLRVVSTELKTPLNVITGYTDMFSEGLLGTLTPIQEKAVETVAKQSRELQGLIDTVLQVSNMETETLDLQLHEVNPWEFLSELRSSYDCPVEKNVKLVWTYPYDMPSVQADRGKLKRILENLINNALRFTEHGTVTVSARYLSSKRLLEFKIADTGVGIPQEQLSKVFEKFRQVQGAKAEMKHGGVGLGLYIVKKYTDLLGGKIYVESRAGEGSTFTLLLPAPLAKRTSAHEQLLLPTGTENFGPG
jgi:signal transduction histidine kinase